MDELPIMNAAGMVKTEADAMRFLQLPVPAILLGSFTIAERGGNSGTTFFHSPGLGSVNSLGLPGPSLTQWVELVGGIRQRATEVGKELWVSVAGFEDSEFADLTEAAVLAGADHVELNLGCPNVVDNGRRKAIASYSPQIVYAALRAALDVLDGKSGVKVGVKLSPILDSSLLEEVCSVLREFDEIAFATAINTVPNCLAIVHGRRAITAFDGLAGMGGPAVKWISLGQLQQMRSFLGEKIDLIGVGGVTTGIDVLDYLSVEGVSRCQVGTAVWQGGPSAILRIGQELAQVL